MGVGNIVLFTVMAIVAIVAYLGPFWAQLYMQNTPQPGGSIDHITLTTGLFYGAFGKHFVFSVHEGNAEAYDNDSIQAIGQYSFPPVSCLTFATAAPDGENRNAFCKFIGTELDEVSAAELLDSTHEADVVDAALAIVLLFAAIALVLTIVLSVRACAGKRGSLPALATLAVLSLATATVPFAGNWRKLSEDRCPEGSWDGFSCSSGTFDDSSDPYTSYQPMSAGPILALLLSVLSLVAICVAKKEQNEARKNQQTVAVATAY